MTSTHRPGREDLARAQVAFRAHESRDLFYRAATPLAWHQAERDPARRWGPRPVTW
jgi:hypothetical protein